MCIEKKCPNCGHCPCCGRSNVSPFTYPPIKITCLGGVVTNLTKHQAIY